MVNTILSEEEAIQVGYLGNEKGSCTRRDPVTRFIRTTGSLIVVGLGMS